MNELKLEVFSSKKRVMETSFHIYDLISSNLEESPFKVIRGACRKLANCNGNIGVFENGKQIMATGEINNIPCDVDFELRPEIETVFVQETGVQGIVAGHAFHQCRIED